MRYLGQALAYTIFAAVLGLLSVWPEYRMLAPQQAILSLSFSHAGERIGECRQLSQEELNKLPPNMRVPAECPRERHSVYTRLTSDEQVLYAGTLQPSGFWKDGKANVYQRVIIDAGHHSVVVGLNDVGSGPEFSHEARFELEVLPGQNRVITFDGLAGQFVLDKTQP